ncbi:MAG: accessory factor UbiK family protein, partial [Alphaproteobacteria bacterium]|nr:accessory factor UbiK family protein [Alphaproteobacteria bacterium]
MLTDNPVLDDLAKLASGGIAVAQELRSEARARLRRRIARALGDLDLVRREEFEAVKAMAARAREENERLAARLAALEAKAAPAPARTP